MHPAHIFDHANRSDALAFIAAHPFAAISRNGEDGPVTALAPVVATSATRMIGHIARNNGFLVTNSDQTCPVSVLFRGADAYVSASYYPSKAEHGKVVPTWNYEAVEVRGRLRFNADPDAMADYLVPLTDQMEAGRAQPWAVTDAPGDYIAKLSRAIVGFDIEVADIRFVRKLSQNKSAQDRAGIIANLASGNGIGDRIMSEGMRLEGSR